MRTRRLIPMIAGLVVAVLAAAGILYFVMQDDEQPSEAEAPDWGFVAGPTAWQDVEPDRDAVLGDTGRVSIGTVELAPPVPADAKDVEWSRASDRVSAKGTLRGAELDVSVRTAQNNSSLAFAARSDVGLDQLSEAIVSEIRLPLGEVSYVNPAYEEVAFASKEVVLPSMSPGPITWRNGDVAIHFWQWQVDRVALRPAPEGETILELTWWLPEQHPLPDDCAKELGDLTIPIEVRGMITFGPLPTIARARLPSGVTSAVVPVFHDPRDHPDARFEDAVSSGPSDYARRARTIALGHSSPRDARHGNGGLIGAGAGGTILVPHEWSESKPIAALREDLAETTVQLVDSAEVSPPECGRWRQAIESKTALLGEPEEFDGRIPNLLAAERRGELPSANTPPFVWPSTQLSGRRKDVVQQAMSGTYLDRLADRRGLSVLKVPIIASRNPLVAVAAESVLEPESNGHWTIQTEIARAFAGIELLAEEDQVDLLSLARLNDYLLTSRRVEIHPRADGAFAIANPTDRAVAGFTLVVDGTVHPMVDDRAPQHVIREVGGGAKQTWIWWDVPARAEHVLRLETPEGASPLALSWTEPSDE